MMTVNWGGPRQVFNVYQSCLTPGLYRNVKSNNHYRLVKFLGIKVHLDGRIDSPPREVWQSVLRRQKCISVIRPRFYEKVDHF